MRPARSASDRTCDCGIVLVPWCPLLCPGAIAVAGLLMPELMMAWSYLDRWKADTGLRAMVLRNLDADGVSQRSDALSIEMTADTGRLLAAAPAAEGSAVGGGDSEVIAGVRCGTLPCLLVTAWRDADLRTCDTR